jgi:hypothetical protein
MLSCQKWVSLRIHARSKVLLDNGGVDAREPAGAVGDRAHGAGSPARARWAGLR